MNNIIQAANLLSAYGKHVCHKDYDKLWNPVKEWTIKNNNISKGIWSAEHVSRISLEKYDPRFELYRRFLEEKSKQGLFIFQLYDIPLESHCTVENILHLGYNIGLYKGYYGHVPGMYEDDYFTLLFSKHDLGNINSYINNKSNVFFSQEEYSNLNSFIHRNVD